MHGLLDHDAAVDAHIRTVFPQRCIQRGKHIPANVGIAAQVLLDAFGSAAFASPPSACASAQTSEALGKVPQIGKLRREMAVDENQPASCAATR